MDASPRLMGAGLLWLLAATACQEAAGTGEAEGSSPILEPCRPKGVPWPGRCTTVEVPRDPGQTDGDRIGLNVVVLAARGRRPEPDPVFLLAGGPGQGASQAFAPILERLDQINETRDIVLVDQRGTGRSQPLECDFGTALQALVADQLPAESVRRCGAMLAREALSVQTWVAVEDLDEVRRVLGYGRINLVGGSYGTRVALAYMRRHPEAVRLAVLDGVAPPGMNMPLHFARDAQGAVDRLLDDCEGDEACRQAFPRLRDHFSALVADTPGNEHQVTVPHPLTGEPTRLQLRAETIAAGLRSLLYVPEFTSLFPWTVEQAAKGDFAPWVSQIHLFSSSTQESLALGMHLAVVCSEDVPLIEEAAVGPATEGTFLGRTLIDEYREACELVPRGTVPKEFHDPVRVAIPTLVLSGELDPVTGPRWGEAVAAELPNAKHVVVAGAGHGTLSVGCIPERLQSVLETGVLEQDFACAGEGRRPPFFVDFAGPLQR